MAQTGITRCSKTSPKTIVVKAPQKSEKKETKVMENVQKVKIAGNAIVLTSTLKFDTIKKMEKYNKKALCLVEVKKDEEIEIFRIGTGKIASLSQYGVTFNEANKDGFAIATIMLPEETKDKKAFIKDNYASALFMLKDLEAAVATDSARLDAAYAELDNYIEEV